jgi:hypothetical protein
MTSPGWYPDPSGQPFQRYWNGNAWTADIHQNVPFGQIDQNPPGYTAPLPYVPMQPIPPLQKPARSWYKKKRYLIPLGIVGALIAAGLIDAGVNPPKDENASNNTSVAAQADTTTSVATSAAAPPAPAAT